MDAVVVAEVDEEQLAVIAIAMDPARQPDGLTHVARAKGGARMRAVAA